ncbi:MAG: hypothetical protein RL685_993 [Pseudomonadota bacterium]
MTDLLLLNATNYQANLIFPYAFVQVRAVARVHGLRVQSLDLYGQDPLAQARVLADTLERVRPRAVGFTLRQADSLVLADYVAPERRPYFPLHATRQAIEQVREVYAGPVVLGGFGFTMQPRELLEHLGADLGVAGEADAFFQDFRGALAGAPLDNVVRPGDSTWQRRSFAPLDEREYDDEVLDQMERFYGRSVLYGAAAPQMAVELARGCPYRCTFCAEPAVKGRRAQVRNLDAVFADIEFASQRGIRSFWLVCSELNHGSSELALQVARRFLALRERHPTRPLSWRAYVLPRWLSDSDMDLLYRSGFIGGWNDFPALDDQSLRANRVPYRTRHIHEHLEQTLALHARSEVPTPASFGAFLGNAHADPRSLLATLDYYDEHFRGKFARAQVGAATRLMATMDAPLLDALRPEALTFRPEGPSTELDLCEPTYALPAALSAVFGPGPAQARDFFEYARVTFLSAEFEASLDWPRFLRQSLSVPWLREQLSQLRLALPPALAEGAVGRALADLRRDPDQALRQLADPESAELESASRVIQIACHRVARRCPVAPRIAEWLGYADAQELSPWRLFRACSLRWESVEEWLAAVPLLDGAEREAGSWLLRYYAFRHGLRLHASFSRLLRAGVAQQQAARRLPVLSGPKPRVDDGSVPSAAARERQVCPQL